MTVAEAARVCRYMYGHAFQPDRRSLLRAGLLGATGIGLADLLRAEATGGTAGRAGRNPSVIILWMDGGPSHIDAFDPKPDAPVEYRGEFRTIPTSVPGIRTTELLPLSARLQQKFSIIRSLQHQDSDHAAGDQICFTGYKAGPNPEQNVYPSCGSIVSKQLGHLTPHLPPYVIIFKSDRGNGPAYLGVAHKPFETLADPADPGPFQVPNFQLAGGLSLECMTERRSLLSGFDAVRREYDATGQMLALDRFSEKAWTILTSPETRDAFDLDKEPDNVRERYGFMPAFNPKEPNRIGCQAWSQRILLARRLVEAGVRLVTVQCGGWDTHVKGFESLRLGILPRWDRAFTALVEDLQTRGLLESTMVLAWGEFGRTPRVNADAGRDHHPNVFSAILAGGPIKGGRAVGESDAKGVFPKSNPKSPQDVLATLYDFLGVDRNAQYVNGSGRPIPVLPFGSPVKELL